MDNYPINNIPQIWFVHRREYLETHFIALNELQKKLLKFSGGNNVISILRAAETLNQLSAQIEAMEETLEANLSPLSSAYDPYNRNKLTRIRNLAENTALQLETIAKQLSWGRSPDQQISKVKRNLYPLIQLVDAILIWLEGVIQ